MLLLALPAFAEKLTLETIKKEFIILNHKDGNINFVNKKFHRKNVLLFFFGKDCPHCNEKVSSMKKLSYNPDINIIGIHAQKDIGDKALKAYIKKVGYRFDVLSFKSDIKLINLLRDRGVWTSGVPFFAFIDPNGNVDPVTLPQVYERLKTGTSPLDKKALMLLEASNPQMATSKPLAHH